MSSIYIKSSMALDTFCFLQKRVLDDTKWMNVRQIEEIRYINSLLPMDFNDNCIGMSNICLVLSACYDGDLELLTLDGLINIFRHPKSIENAVKERIKDGFEASYIHPVLDWLNDGFADEYVKKLTALKEVGFEEIYKERILPLVSEEIKAKEKEVAQYDAKELFNNISKLKNTAEIDGANIYVSFFSAPTAFTLYGGSFLTCFCPPDTVDFYSIIAHELMHGFASDELTELYRKHTESSEYLSSRHRALIEDYHSGDEEEFVMAAEYYLCYLSGKYTKEQLLSKAKNQYGGSCPTSVAIFELLAQEKEPPIDYNEWLISKFKHKK